MVQFASFTKRHSSSLSRTFTRSLHNMVRHKSGNWEADAAAANAAVAVAAARKKAADYAAAHESGSKVSEPERTQFYLRQGVN